MEKIEAGFLHARGIARVKRRFDGLLFLCDKNSGFLKKTLFQIKHVYCLSAVKLLFDCF